jgi:hypothetical protein
MTPVISCGSVIIAQRNDRCFQHARVNLRAESRSGAAAIIEGGWIRYSMRMIVGDDCSRLGISGSHALMLAAQIMLSIAWPISTGK